MEPHLSEESLWASALAARLKILQANFADDDAATREGYIVQEIEHALKGCVPEKRKTLLEALAVRFPSAPTSATVAAEAKAFAQPPETPESLFERFMERMRYFLALSLFNVFPLPRQSNVWPRYIPGSPPAILR